MIPSVLSERARDLRAHGEPFVTATVVRTEKPTSAQAGNVALVHSDGTIEGFVGGVCAQHSVRLYSLQAIETGEPVLLRIMPASSPEADAAGSEPEPVVDDGSTSLSGQELAREGGTVTVRNPCLSGGALELFLEPELPAPRVLVFGDSPIVGSLLALGPEVGLEVTASTGDRPLTPQPGDLGLIVAAHGHDEVAALRAGLEAGLPYVGLVASPTRGAAVLADLRADGVADELVARVDTPAGLDIGARTAGEIALSVLAQLVAVRRGHPLPNFGESVKTICTQSPKFGSEGRGAATEGRKAATAVDPVCGMTVVIVPGTPAFSVGGQTQYFCCEACKLAYEREHRAV